jgi:hypothetical protein
MGRRMGTADKGRRRRGIDIIIKCESLRSPLRLILRPIGLIAIGRGNATDVVSPMVAIRA